MSTFLFLLYSLKIVHIFGYAFIGDSKVWYESHSFCSTDCDSNLLSIHSNEEYDELIASLPNTTNMVNYNNNSNIWIGLSRSNSDAPFTWSDASNFDFGNKTDGGIEPWDIYNPTKNEVGHRCVIMDKNNNNKWKDIQCSTNNPFVCNSCSYNNYNTLQTYYVSLLHFTASEGRIYCSNHCNSNIGSIHYEKDMQRIIYLTQNNKEAFNIYIGMNRSYSYNSFTKWQDDSNLDYGRIEREYPWFNNQPISIDDTYCVQMTNDKMYQWEAIKCNKKQPFVCNSCDGKLNKYIINTQHRLTWIEADRFCKIKYDTELGSIHSIDTNNDRMEILQQMEVSEINTVWIGLNDIDNDGQYTWSDNTYFDGDSSIYPVGKCLYIDINDGVMIIKSAECNDDDVTYSFICAAPSESAENDNWNEIDDGVLISNKQWINKNGLLSIDYTFGITDIVDGDGYKTAGIMISNFNDTICDFYYIAIQIRSIDPLQAQLIFVKNVNGSFDVLQSKELESFQLNISVPLKVMVQDGVEFDIYLNEKYMFHISDSLSIPLIESMITSGYIGVYNNNLKTVSKWMYISGAIWDVDKKDGYNFDFNRCNIIYPTTTTSQPFITTDPVTSSTNTYNTTTTHPITTDLAVSTTYYTTTEPVSTANPSSVSSTAYYTSSGPTTAPNIGNKPTLSAQRTTDREHEVMEETESTILGERDENANNNEDEKDNSFNLVVIVVVIIVCLVCCGFVVYLRRKQYIKKREKIQNEIDLNEATDIRIIGSKHVKDDTDSNSDNNNNNNTSYKTPGPPQRIKIIEMEGGISSNNKKHGKSKTEEFKQMLGDNLLVNNLMMNDVVQDINSDIDTSYVETPGGPSEFEGTPIVTRGGPDNYDVVPSTPGSMRNDEDMDTMTQETAGGDEENIAEDEFVVDGDEEIIGDVYETPIGTMGGNNDMISGPITNGSPTDNDENDENVSPPTLPPAQIQDVNGEI